jgi:hypothetical protein
MESLEDSRRNKPMSDINSVSLSGIVAHKVEISEAKGFPVAHFYIDVEGGGQQKPKGKFKIVAYAECVEVARKPSVGDRILRCRVPGDTGCYPGQDAG